MPARPILRYFAEKHPWDQLSKYGIYKELQETGKLLLGCEGYKTSKGIKLNPKRPVYIPFDPTSENSPSFLVMSRKGSGKTTIGANITHQVTRMYGIKAFIVDPKAKMYYHKYPQENQKHIDFLKKVGITAQGLPIKTITPAIFKSSPKYNHSDIFYSLGMEDFDRITDYSFKRELMLTLLGLHAHPGSKLKIDKVLSKSPKSFTQMLQYTEELNADQYFNKIRVFDNSLKQKLMQGIIADKRSIDIVELLQKHVVILQCSLSTTEEFNSTYVAFAMAQIKDGFETGKLLGKTMIMVDEGDVLCPSGNKNPPSKTYIEQMFTKWRSDGAIPFMIVQDPAKVSSTVLQQVDYVLTSRISYGAGESDFLGEHFSSLNIYQVSQLDFGPLAQYPKEWEVIDPEENVQKFYPIPPPSMPHAPSYLNKPVPRIIEA